MYKRILLLLLIVCFGCEDLLFHEEDNKYYIIDSEEELYDLVNGIYLQIARVYNESYFEIYGRSDDINSYPNYSFSHDGHSCSTSGFTVDYAEISGTIYLHFYQAIAVINRLLPIVKEETHRYLLGELYFLRAYCYFQLARLFGTPPLVTDIDVNYFIEKPSYSEVYAFIEADMEKALEMLPENVANVRIPEETPHKGTAKALMAEIYLAMAGFPLHDEEKYAEAAQLAGEVINNAGIYGYRLLDDFAHLWKSGEYRHNSECIFGLYYNAMERESSNRIASTFYVNDYYTNGSHPFSGGYNCDFMFFDTYPNSYRKYHSFVTGWYNDVRYDTIGDYKTSLKFFPYNPIENPCGYVGGAVTLKWFDLEDASQQDTWLAYSNVTLYLLRYTHILLTYAEAKARSSGLDASCYEAVNRIRRRANHVDVYTPSEFDLQDGLSSEQFLDSVVWERAWELCTEPSGRWFDIVRLDMREEIETNRYPEDRPIRIDESLLNENWYFFLIPQEDRWVNPYYWEE
jgi:starch-binding outer membrane protein, SusD/RagB family